MKLQIYSVLAATLFSLAGLSLIIWKIGPETASLLLKIIFFAAFLIFIWGTTTLVSFFIKIKTSKAEEKRELDDFYSSLLGGLIVTILIFIAIIVKKII